MPGLEKLILTGAVLTGALVGTGWAEAGEACLRAPPVLAVSTPSVGPLLPHITAVFDISVSNADEGSCPSRALTFSFLERPAGLALFVDPPQLFLAPGQRADLLLSVTGTEEAAPGAYDLSFQVRDTGRAEAVEGEVRYALRAERGCFVRPERELMIRELSVVEEPARTTFAAAPDDPRRGAWTFGRLMESMAPSPAEASAFVERFFRGWLRDEQVNGFTVHARRGMADLVLRPWPRLADGALDLARSPLRLLAIVNRLSLRNRREHRPGQGRFVFGVVDQDGAPFPFTVILEYRLPGEPMAWARRWHHLASLTGEDYLRALQAITDGFSARGADPAGVNGSALASIRTNEVVLGFPWELRSFALSPADGYLQPVSDELTPDIGYLDSPLLATFINERQDRILADDYRVPELFRGVPFLSGSAPNTVQAWNAPGIIEPGARRHFAVNTCNGCHSTPDTRTGFVHVSPRASGERSALSGFLLGVAVSDPFTGEQTVFNELQRRKADLESLVCRGEDPGGDGGSCRPH